MHITPYHTFSKEYDWKNPVRSGGVWNPVCIRELIIAFCGHVLIFTPFYLFLDLYKVILLYFVNFYHGKSPFHHPLRSIMFNCCNHET